MTTIHTIASGSSGNALLFSWDGGRFLLDAGISCRRILTALSALGVRAPDLDGILITHTHVDHVHGLQTLLKRTDCPVYASDRACRELDYRFAAILDRLFPLQFPKGAGAGESNDRTAAQIEGTGASTDRTAAQGEGTGAGGEPDGCVTVKGCRITAVPASHDAPGTCGWRLDTPDGGFGFLTDTGLVTEAARAILPGVRFVLLEANHDIEAVRSGPYPYPLKQRILGPYGHLCNEDAGEFAAELARAGAERIVLAHLSAENNTPAMALRAVQSALNAADLSPALTAAPRDGLWLAFRTGTETLSDVHSDRTASPHGTASPIGSPCPDGTAARRNAEEAALCGG